MISTILSGTLLSILLQQTWTKSKSPAAFICYRSQIPCKMLLQSLRKPLLCEKNCVIVVFGIVDILTRLDGCWKHDLNALMGLTLEAMSWMTITEDKSGNIGFGRSTWSACGPTLFRVVMPPRCPVLVWRAKAGKKAKHG
jgi:hypothetical protein